MRKCTYCRHFFSHPDYTVGSGISPNQPLRLTDLCQRQSLSVRNHTLPRRMFQFTKTIITLYKYLRKPNFASKVNAVAISLSENPYRFIIYNFMVSAILFFAASTLKTLTSTISPTLTASSGCLIYLSVICEICTSPS